MKSTFISKEKNDVKFTMEFTAEELEQGMIKAYQESKDQFDVDGFRKGKAPRGIIEKKYGENVFLEEGVNHILGQSYPQAISELELQVVDSPRMEFSKLEKGKDFTATVTVAVYPEVEVKDYKGVEVEEIKAEVTDEDLSGEMEQMQMRNARMIAVERPVEKGDTVLLDYKGFVGDEQFEGGTAEKFPLKIGSGSFIPGFEDQLIGAEIDSDLDVKVTFPEEYHAENLAGKDAVFHCHIHEVKKQEVPLLDDEFAKDVSEFDTLEELKEDTRKNLLKTKEAQAKNTMKDKVLEVIYNNTEVDVPESMVQEEINNMLNEFEQQLRAQGMTTEQYFKYIGKDAKDFREEVRGDAEKRVKTRMIVTAIADAEKLEATADEIEAEINNMATQYKMEAEKIKEMLGEQNLEFLGKDLRMRKAIDLIFDNAVIK